MRSVSPWLLIPTILASAPSEAGGPGPAPGIPGRTEFRLGNHLVAVPVPPGWTAGIGADGIRLDVAGAEARRAAPTLHLARGDGTAGPPGNWPDRRRVGDRTAAFRITRSEGGSGGDEIELAAWVSCGTGHLLLRYVTQAEEPSGPDLRPAWHVLEGTTCRTAPP